MIICYQKTQKNIRDEARKLVKWVPRQMIIDMDADKIQFPKEFLQEAGRRNLLGCRYPQKWGGRGMDWVTASAVMDDMRHLHSVLTLKDIRSKPHRRLEQPTKTQAEVLSAYGYKVNARGVLQKLTS